jgi:hypothetical protein
MTVAQVNEIEIRKEEILARRKLLAPLVSRFNLESGAAYRLACVAAGLPEDADERDAKDAIKQTVDEMKALPKVSMNDFLAWKKAR